MALQSQLELCIGSHELLFLFPANSGREMSLGSVHGLKFLNLRLGFLLSAAHDSGSRAIEFDQSLPRRKVLLVKLHGNLKFSVRLSRQSERGKHRRMVRLL